MKRRTATVAAAAIASGLGAVAILAFAFRLEPELLLKDGAGRILACIPLPDARFDHVFIHSFHLTPVEERFIVESSGFLGARLRLYELRYESLGVGMPDDAELGFRLENGKFILAMDRRFDRIPIMVSIVAGHGIVAGGTFHPFTEWVPPEGRIALEGRLVPVFRIGR